MNQNKKIWLFVEGFCEVQFVRWMFIKFFSNFFICNSETSFLEQTNLSCYIHNSRDVNKIPYDINDMNHWIERSDVCSVIIVCDTENKLYCPIKRKDEIIEIIDSDAESKTNFNPIDKNKFKFVFSKPTIEDIYCSEKEITASIIKATGETHEKVLEILSNQTIPPLDRLKQSFRINKSTYKKREFSEKFFSQLDYERCNNKSVLRLYRLVKELSI